MSGGGKRPGAGRPVGSINRKSIEIENLLKSMEVDPIKGMALIASNDKQALGITEDVPISIRAQMYKELAPYVAFKLRAVEINLADSTTIPHEERLKLLE